MILKCFAGCDVHEITVALGLDLADLFVKSDQQTYDKKTRSCFHEWQILEALRFDAMVVLIAARRVLAGEPSTEADVDFLSKAVIRIHEAVNYSVRGGR